MGSEIVRDFEGKLKKEGFAAKKKLFFAPLKACHCDRGGDFGGFGNEQEKRPETSCMK